MSADSNRLVIIGDHHCFQGCKHPADDSKWSSEFQSLKQSTNTPNENRLIRRQWRDKSKTREPGWLNWFETEKCVRPNFSGRSNKIGAHPLPSSHLPISRPLCATKSQPISSFSSFSKDGYKQRQILQRPHHRLLRGLLREYRSQNC